MKKLLFSAMMIAICNAYATNVHMPEPVRGYVKSNQSQNQVQNQSQSQSTKSNAYGGQSNSVSTNTINQSNPVTTSDSNNASMSVVTKSPRQVASAAAIAVMPTAVCSGSTGAGAQGSAFGLSFGTSWTDQNCMLLEQVRMVASLGDEEVAQEMLCAIDGYREARIRVGRPCKQASTDVKPVKADQYTDPIVRHRLGLPPL